LIVAPILAASPAVADRLRGVLRPF